MLAVTSQMPWPLNSGGHLRTFHLLRSLAEAFEVRLIVPVERRSRLSCEPLEDHGIRVRPVHVGSRQPWTEAARVVGAAVAGEPYVLFRRHRRARVRAMIGAEFAVRRPDVFYLDHLDSFNYGDCAAGVPLVADMHNVYSTIAGRAADDDRRPLAGPYLRREMQLLDRMERRLAQAADLITAVSEADMQHFRSCGARRVVIVPNGVDCRAHRSLPAADRTGAPVILYVATLSWKPNIAGAVYLAHHVLPRLRAVFPDARLRIVGRDPAPEVIALGRLDHVDMIGPVADVSPHWRDAHVLAVPLDVGGGTRLKILEAFGAGVPVVSTPIGCEGLEVEHRTHLLVAEADEFAASIAAVLSDASLARTLARRARRLAAERYDWSSIGATATQAAQMLLERSRSAA